mgnify:CR=1 FL=1
MIRNFPLGKGSLAHRYLSEFLYADGEWSPEIRAAWEQVKPGQIQLIRQAANACPERFLFATDTPLAISRRLGVELYREALGGHGELWDLVMRENARRLFKL